MADVPSGLSLTPPKETKKQNRNLDVFVEGPAESAVLAVQSAAAHRAKSLKLICYLRFGLIPKSHNRPWTYSYKGALLITLLRAIV
jgi:hypothetical protein